MNSSHTSSQHVASGARTPWWQTAVVYQIYVRSFRDANGDGRGDLEGIMDRLDHLEELGVDAVWLTPCYPSPQHDHGYDVADYFDIEPEYGTLETFDALVAAARGRGIRLMMDVVPNHSSSEHEWFRAALVAGPGSRERERYWFREGRGDHGELPPNNWRAVFGGSAWTRVVEPDGSPGQWYLHTFTPWQPDFNWHHDDVVDHFARMLRFWFDRGVDGFRVDAVTVVGKHPELPDSPPPPPGRLETDAWTNNPYTLFWPTAHDHWRHWRSIIDDYEREHPGRELVTVSEAYTPGRPDLLLSFVQPDQFHQSFSFDLMLCPWNGPMIHEAIDSVYRTLSGAGASLTWTLNNHDTERSVTRYGRADAHRPGAWSENNLAHSEAPVDLAVGTRRHRAMLAMTAALPGSLYLYQGEELGLPEVLDIAPHHRQDPIYLRTEGREVGRDGCRVPLPWSSEVSNCFGFSSADAEPWLPQPHDWGTYATGPEHDVSTSMLGHYRRVLALRRELASAAPLEWIPVEHESIVAFCRGDVAVVLNVGGQPVALPERLIEGAQLILSSRDSAESASALHEIPGDTCLWIRAPHWSSGRRV